LIHESDTILDIGCNCGFMLIYASYRKGCSGDGIDINPFMINIGRAVTDFLELSHKIRLFQDSFLLFQPTKKYSVIFSFAAYWTDDGLLRPDFDLYMRKMHELLYDGGIIIFETHSNDANNPEFHKKMENFRDIFSFDKGILLDNNERELFFLKKI
jgi:SAM-dependent methyltransferase